MGITSVTMDLAEHHIFCGGTDGSIFQVDLCSWVSGPLRLREPTVLCPASQTLTICLHPQPGLREHSFQAEQNTGKVFKGHR